MRNIKNSIESEKDDIYYFTYNEKYIKLKLIGNTLEEHFSITNAELK